jgi:Sporulation protein YtfJ (Spore_YtfJ)
MTTGRSKAMDQASHAAEGGATDRFLERLADRMGGRAGVQAVFGEPIQHGDLTVVPVARIRWVFGGGAGSGADAAGDGGSGSGGGGGVSAEPIGYLEIGPVGASFEPIVSPYPSPLFLLASGIAAAVVLRALARLIRR